jgi:hypothetical protein
MTSHAHKGRGAVNRPPGRFEQTLVKLDAEADYERAAQAPETVLRATMAGRIISKNNSPDIPFDQSINPYQGCEHGCVYCYARPSHSYLDLSPGLDFETQIYYKPNAVKQLLDAWEKTSYECKPITIGANTDPYQPAEKIHSITRQLLEQFLECRHPVTLITKSNLILRDLDLLAELARRNLCSVAVSIPTLADSLKRIMEPRVPSAVSRLKAIKLLGGPGRRITSSCGCRTNSWTSCQPGWKPIFRIARSMCLAWSAKPVAAGPTTAASAFGRRAAARTQRCWHRAFERRAASSNWGREVTRIRWIAHSSRDRARGSSDWTCRRYTGTGE